MMTKKEYENFAAIILRSISILLKIVGGGLAVMWIIWKVTNYPDNAVFTESGKPLSLLSAFLSSLCGVVAISDAIITKFTNYIVKKVCRDIT